MALKHLAKVLPVIILKADHTLSEVTALGKEVKKIEHE